LESINGGVTLTGFAAHVSKKQRRKKRIAQSAAAGRIRDQMQLKQETGLLREKRISTICSNRARFLAHSVFLYFDRVLCSADCAARSFILYQSRQ
jgi:hypothetical protein